MSLTPISNNGVSDIFTIVNSADGSKATVHSQGGHVTSWVGKDGDERLFLSPAHKFGTGKAIRGGVPIIFPQFSDMGSGPTHGAVRSRQWKPSTSVPAADGVGAFEIVISEDDKDFPNMPCRLTLIVSVSDARLTLTARVDQTRKTVATAGDDEVDTKKSSDFGFAFHTYFAVSDIANVTLDGFDDGMVYADNLQNRKLITDAPKSITKIDQEIDRIYVGVPNKKKLKIIDAATGTLSVSGDNLPDVVLWNPWVEKNARLADLPQPDGYKRFICIEHGVLMPRVALPEAGSVWEGSQIVEFQKN